MARYLVVAHQTAKSPELRRSVQEIAAHDGNAVFTLLVPATPPDRLLTWTDGQAAAIAATVGEEARQRWEADGLVVDQVLVGDANPIYAVGDAFSDGQWDRVVVSTFPVGVSRWLRQDVVHRLERESPVPVTHVVAG